MKLFKNGISIKWLLLIIGIVTVSGVAIASVNPVISAVHSYLDILHVNYFYGDISNATGALPNASIPASAANVSADNTFTGTGTTTFVGSVVVSTTNSSSAAVNIERDMTDTNEAAGIVQMRIRGKSDPNLELTLGYNTQSDYALIQANKYGVGAKNLILQKYGGNVGFAGNTTPFYDVTIGTSPWSGVNAGDAAFTTSSSRELKTNITEINITKSYERISKLKPSTFRWNVKNASNMTNVSNKTIWGLIADDTNIIYPGMQKGTVEWSMVLIDLVSTSKYLIQENQDQRQQIALLEARVQKLEDRGILDILFAKQIDYLYNYLNLTKP